MNRAYNRISPDEEDEMVLVSTEYETTMRLLVLNIVSFEIITLFCARVWNSVLELTFSIT
jgi:hypothetical protein